MTITPALLDEIDAALEPVSGWLNHLSAIGSRHLEDFEYPEMYGVPKIGKLRTIVVALAKLREARQADPAPTMSAETMREAALGLIEGELVVAKKYSASVAVLALNYVARKIEALPLTETKEDGK